MMFGNRRYHVVAALWLLYLPSYLVKPKNENHRISVWQKYHDGVRLKAVKIDQKWPESDFFGVKNENQPKGIFRILGAR